MDANQFKQFMAQQATMMDKMIEKIRVREAPAGAPVLPVPTPSPLMVDGDMEENFDFFERSWEEYVKATSMNTWPATADKQKVSYLLSVIGEPARKKFFNFELTEAERATPALALKAIREKVVPKRNVIVDRLEFFSATQSSRESVDEYSTRLKTLARVAKLGTLNEELITYKLITSNKWPQLRSKMLAMTDLTLEKVVDMCRAEEITAKRSQDLAVPDAEVNKVAKSKFRRKSQQLPLCKFCGDEHDFTKGSCPALGKRCRRCNGKNHFEKACRVKRGSSKKSSRK